MSAFANLMALSATQTKQQESAMEVALRERGRKEALQKKMQQEKEEKDREMEKQRRLKLFADQKREEERRKQMEEAKQARERALQRRENEERDKLLYGPKKAAKLSSASSAAGPSTSGGSSAARNGHRRTSDESDDDSGPIPLTREEKRQRKQQAEMKRLYGVTKRPSTSATGYQKAGRRLPGGAVDITAASPTSVKSGTSGSEHKSVKERMQAMPNVLMKLNQVKRDTRTIDEIMQDRAKAKEGKVLEGDQALVFDDWFGTKKKEKTVATSRPPSLTPTSGTNTPLPSQSSTSAISAQKRANTNGRPAATRPSATSHQRPSVSIPSSRLSTSTTTSRPAPSDRAPDRAKSTQSKPSRNVAYDQHSSSAARAATSSSTSKKRNHSISRSESPPPPKRRHRSVDSDDLDEDYSATIWKLFGRDRSQYVSRNVMSDDEDMEADARALELEEKQSSRLAVREEQRALEEERRHEEEKRRRRKERERAAR